MQRQVDFSDRSNPVFMPQSAGLFTDHCPPRYRSDGRVKYLLTFSSLQITRIEKVTATVSRGGMRRVATFFFQHFALVLTMTWVPEQICCFPPSGCPWFAGGCGGLRGVAGGCGGLRRVAEGCGGWKIAIGKKAICLATPKCRCNASPCTSQTM